mmetsp:Transcript_2479/g.7478  ORF Transcript_2479/g.7478 Transcript_2479/m.7478 type:complete len:221 (+) Transcript_2479:609-1271(+)
MVHAAGEAPLRRGASAQQRAGGVQGHAHHDEEHQDDHDGLEGQRQRGPVDDRRRVDHHEASEDHGGQEQTLVDHGPLPMLASEHAENAPALVTSRDDGDQVRDDEGCRGGTTLGIVRIHDREEQDTEDGACDVHAGGVEHGEDGEVVGSSENVAIHLLPSALIAAVHALELLRFARRISREVALERLHQNDGHDSAQKERQHERVHDRKPVDLVLEELRV